MALLPCLVTNAALALACSTVWADKLTCGVVHSPVVPKVTTSAFTTTRVVCIAKTTLSRPAIVSVVLRIRQFGYEVVQKFSWSVILS